MTQLAHLEIRVSPVVVRVSRVLGALPGRCDCFPYWLALSHALCFLSPLPLPLPRLLFPCLNYYSSVPRECLPPHVPTLFLTSSSLLQRSYLCTTQDPPLASAASRTKPNPCLGAHTPLQLPRCSAPWAFRASQGCKAPGAMGDPSSP